MQEWTDGIKLAVDVLVAYIIVITLIICTQLSRTIMLIIDKERATSADAPEYRVACMYNNEKYYPQDIVSLVPEYQGSPAVSVTTRDGNTMSWSSSSYHTELTSTSINAVLNQASIYLCTPTYDASGSLSSYSFGEMQRMEGNLSTAYKIAADACIMAFILSIGLSLMMIGRDFRNKTADQVTTSVISMQDTDAFFLASYEKPVPIADIQKMVMCINYGASSIDANGNISKFSIEKHSPSDPNDRMLIPASVDDLDDYMARRAYMSWEVDEVTGFYTMEMSLAE